MSPGAGGGEEGKRACEAIDALSKLSAVNKMLSAFIKVRLSRRHDPDTYLCLLSPIAPAAERG